MWKRLQQQQQRGAQVAERAGGEAPAEAVAGRSAQQHDEADQQVARGDAPRQPVYPAGRMEDEAGDNTPTAPEPNVDWNDMVQPEGRRDRDQPLSEGK